MIAPDVDITIPGPVRLAVANRLLADAADPRNLRPEHRAMVATLAAEVLTGLYEDGGLKHTDRCRGSIQELPV